MPDPLANIPDPRPNPEAAYDTTAAEAEGVLRDLIAASGITDPLDVNILLLRAQGMTVTQIKKRLRLGYNRVTNTLAAYRAAWLKDST